MRSELLPFSRPSLSEQDIHAVSEVLRSGWITTGGKAADFERQFCDSLGCQSAVAVSSATAGMHLLLSALRIGPGDEVITPSLTWVSTVNLIVLSGATPVFVDVERDTLMTSADLIRDHISERTRLIIPVHYAGAAADLVPLQQLADRWQVPLVEDAAHALGTHYRGKPIGQHGTAIFSFHPIKNITTGEGGMFCSEDVQLAARIRRLKFHGLGVDAYERHTQGRAPQAEVLEPGYKYNMPDIMAALGLSQLTRVAQLNEKRTQLACYYHKRLSEIEEIWPLAVPSDTLTHAWHLFIVRLDIDKSGLSRDAFMNALKARNIGTGLHFRPVHTQKYYWESLSVRPDALPNTEWNAKRICSLPLFPDMSFADVDDVVEAIKTVLTFC